ncbi:MAG: LuxR C-terminal-related transcriptional regulator [Methyloligellaceae bacterium]
MSDVVRVAIVDDHPLFRMGISAVLGRCEDMDVVAEGCSCDEIPTVCGGEHPDILVVDVAMNGDVLTAIRQCAADKSGTRVVVLSASVDHDHLTRTLDAGARGYLLKTESADTIISALRSVFGGETYVTPSLAARMFNQIKKEKSAPDIRSELWMLTQRETEILYCIGLGHTNRSIARELKIGEKTVKHHMTNIMSKLQVQNRVQAALLVQTAALESTTH